MVTASRAEVNGANLSTEAGHLDGEHIPSWRPNALDFPLADLAGLGRCGCCIDEGAVGDGDLCAADAPRAVCDGAAERAVAWREDDFELELFADLDWRHDKRLAGVAQF